MTEKSDTEAGIGTQSSRRLGNDGKQADQFVSRKVNQFIRIDGQVGRKEAFIASLAAMLDQVASTGAVRNSIVRKPAHHVVLVVGSCPGPFSTSLFVMNLYWLGLAVQDVGQALAGQRLASWMVGFDPDEVGGLSMSLSQLRKGRNHDASPLRRVQKRTSVSSTAKCAIQRPSPTGFSLGLRSVLHCSTVSSAICLAKLFSILNAATAGH